jgi:hypothetical protein
MTNSNTSASDRFRDDAERRSSHIAEIRELRAAILDLLDRASISEPDRQSVIESIESIEKRLHSPDRGQDAPGETPPAE